MDRDSLRQPDGDFDLDFRLENLRGCQCGCEHDLCCHRRAGVERDLEEDLNASSPRHSRGESDCVLRRGLQCGLRRDSLTDLGGRVESDFDAS